MIKERYMPYWEQAFYPVILGSAYIKDISSSVAAGGIPAFAGMKKKSSSNAALFRNMINVF